MSGRKTNTILHDYGDGTILIDISTPKHPNSTSKMDAVDFARLPGRVYMTNRYPRVNRRGRSVKVHRFLFPDYEETDHINRDKTDNRRCNIRDCTRTENQHNKPRRSDNSSGMRGVVWDKRKLKWRARLENNGRRISLGHFVDKADATRARLEAEKLYFGEFAPQHESLKSGSTATASLNTVTDG